MQKQLKDKWVAALRSGAYKQVTGKLETLDAEGNILGNCCLGVLCRVMEISSKKHIDGELKYTEFNFGKYNNVYDRLPDSIRMRLMIPPLIENVLIDKNDGYGGHKCDFLEIADFIEANIPEEMEG